MADATLTPSEQKFFETGELPADLQQNAPSDGADEAAAALARVTGAQPPAQGGPGTPTVPPTGTPVPNETLEFLQRSLQAEQQRAADAEARLRALSEQNITAAKPPPIDATVDPIGAMLQQLTNVSGTVQQLQERLVQQQQQQEQLQQLQNFQTSIRSVREDFTKITPDFPKAYEHLRMVQSEDMRSLGHTEAAIQDALLRGELNIAQTALRAGKNPAAVMYDMAKRHGYTAVVAPPATALQTKIDNLKQGTATAKQPAASSPPAAPITLDGLKAASESDLDALVRNPDTWARIAGGESSPDIFSH